jgi:beta-glucanase (GH16 family)
LTIYIRVDNPGDWHSSPWDQDDATIAPGQTAKVTVYMGYSWGNPGYAINPSKISQVLLFISKPSAPVTFQVLSVKATGASGDHPAGLITKVVPTNGDLLSFKAGAFKPYQIQSIGNTTRIATANPGYAELTFVSSSGTPQTITTFTPPAASVWDLSNFDQVQFALYNPGKTPIHVYGRVDNAWASATDNSALADTTVAANSMTTLTVPFASPKPWDGSDRTSGCRLDAAAVVGISIYGDPSSIATVIDVKSIRATVAKAPAFPTWLGERPPVPGKWTMTLNQDFKEPVIDQNVWVTIDKPTASIWDTVSVEVGENAYVASGLLTIKTDKPATDKFTDPSLAGRQYLTSVLTTYGKFTQKYGYFEAKMKLPNGLGMWPAFWLMPDRGPKFGNEWERQDTKNGGMEFDILEYLVRFGPYHYNIATHWDGYDKLHQSIGNERIYFQPDKDGFVAAGLLWGPGEVTFYCNGKIVGHWKNDRISNVPEYIMFTQPLGGWGTNGYVDGSKLPQYFKIKYVRVWQRDDWKNIPDGPPLVPTPAIPGEH